MTSATNDEAAIRELLAGLVEAIRAMDLDGIRRFYASDIVSFDFEPPLSYTGLDAKLGNWKKIFATHERPLGYELRDLVVCVSGDVVFSHSLNRISGMRTNGTPANRWVRCTNCFRKIEGRWLIVHDHVSVPADAGSGRAMLDLAP
jgi:ketosteroid isomerase-like protein